MPSSDPFPSSAGRASGRPVPAESDPSPPGIQLASPAGGGPAASAPPAASTRAAPGGLRELGGPDEPWWQRLRAGTGSVPAGGARIVALAVAAALAGGAVVWAWGAGQPRASGSSPVLPMATRAPSGTVEEPVTSAPPTTAGDLWVAIAGAVERPGLYRVPSAARLSSLIAAAGGLRPEADEDRVNLAAGVRDGERVYVPRRGEASAPPVIAGGGPADGAGAVPGEPAGEPAGSESAPSLVDINHASAEELDRLPGVGPVTARAIIDHRRTKGPFTSAEDLTDVRGIGPARLEQLRPLVVVR